MNSREIKLCSQSSRRLHFNSSEVSNVVNTVRDLILILVKENSIGIIARDFFLNSGEVKQRSQRFQLNSGEVKHSSKNELKPDTFFKY